MKKETEDTKEERKSLAMQFVDTLKEFNKRLFLVWLITFAALTSLVVYTIYLLNDIAVIETTETTQEITDIYSIENSTITNGE